jgi:hypothetical protein
MLCYAPFELLRRRRQLEKSDWTGLSLGPGRFIPQIKGSSAKSNAISCLEVDKLVKLD